MGRVSLSRFGKFVRQRRVIASVLGAHMHGILSARLSWSKPV